MRSREMAVNYEALKDKTAEFALMHELEDIIVDALESLPEPCRIVFDMSRSEELSYSEIADRLNISVKTVEYRMMQALRIFRSKMLPYLSIIVFFLGVK